MPGKSQLLRRIDQKLPYKGGGTGVGAAGDALSPASPTNLLPPTNLTIDNTGVTYTSQAADAYAALVWRAPANGPTPSEYQIDWSESSSFASGVIVRRTGRAQTSAVVDGLPVGALVYFRVRAIYLQGVSGPMSDTASATMPEDTTPPAAPTSLSTSWSSSIGDLSITWTNPTSRNLRWCRLRIYASNGGALLREIYTSAGRYVWMRAQQYADTGGAYDPDVYLVVTAYNWSGTASASDLTGTATLAAPSAPSGMATSWDSDTGTAGADLVISWTLSSSVAGYRLTLDGGTPINLGLVSSYTYTLAANAAQHAGTPDAAISVSLVAVDALGQTSTAATTTATNAAPPATTISASGNFATLSLIIAASAAADIKDYRIRAYLNGSGTPSDTFYTTSLLSLYEPPASGSWRVDVAARDVFDSIGTASSLTTTADTTNTAEFVAGLRREITYSDSLGTSADTLEAALADDNTASGGIAYTAGAWRWVLADWGETIRHRTTTLSLSASVGIYLGTSQDGATWTYHYGGSVSGGVWAPASTTATEATAQAGAVSLSGVVRIELGATQRARYIKLGLNGAATLREYYPRRLVQTDDLQAEAVTARAIAAAAITTDKVAAGAITATLINVTSLSAVSANLGTITAGSISSVAIASSTITGGTITGAFITTTGGDLQITNSAGVTMLGGTTPNKYGVGEAGRAIKWNSTLYGDIAAQIYSYTDTSNVLNVVGGAYGFSWSINGKVVIRAESYLGSAYDATLTVDGAANLVTSSHWLANAAAGYGLYNAANANYLYSELNHRWTLTGNGTHPHLCLRDNYASTIRGYLYSDATGFGLLHSGGGWMLYANGSNAVVFPGSIAVSSSGAGINTGGPVASIMLCVNGVSAGTTAFGLAVRDNASNNNLYVRNDGYVWTKGTIDVGGLNNRSDERLKTAIAPIADALDTLRQFAARQWRWAADPDGPIHYGPIAQEAERVAPELVAEGQPGPGEALLPGARGLLSIRQASYVGLIHAALLQLDARLTALEAV